LDGSGVIDAVMGGVKRPWTFQGGDVQVKTEFDRDEISFLAAVTGALAEGARRGCCWARPPIQTVRAHRSG